MALSHMPNFDATDQPLLDRIYCVPHRSKFYSVPAELQSVTQQYEESVRCGWRDEWREVAIWTHLQVNDRKDGDIPT